MATFLVIITGVRVFSATQVSPKQNYIAETLGLQKKTKNKKTKKQKKLGNIVFPLIITIISSIVTVA